MADRQNNSATLMPVGKPPITSGANEKAARIFRGLNDLAGRALPESMNPMAQTGAIANTLFIVATISGILLLIWYRPSLHQAYDSVSRMTAAVWTGGLLRSIHRYSSDACMFFVIVHALYLFFAGRFRGPRWLAWVTGILLWTLLEMIGWTGYWLVWDERGQIVATGSAKVMDLIPIFADPLSRSFLTNETINSLFFFVIFFFHMVVPLGMAGGIYIHIARINRARFLTSKQVTSAIMVGLLLMAWLLPADLAKPANMLVNPADFPIDAWYLAPLWLLERTTGGLFLALFLLTGAVLYSIPFWRRQQPAAAEVEVSRCNACMKCYQDCPYNAISMVPRTDGKNYHAQSFVDPMRCVSCGICAGSCDSAGIGVPYMDVLDVRRNIEAVVQQLEEKPYIVFLCQDSLNLKTDPDGRNADLPNTLVQKVPCLGWIHPLTVERLIKRQVPGVVLAGCGSGTCTHREGADWTKDRFEGRREPILRSEIVPPEKILLLQRDLLTLDQLRRSVKQFTRGERPEKPQRLAWKVAAAIMLAFTMLAIALPTRSPWLGATDPEPQLIVSFKHAGEIKTTVRERSAEELESLPVHMRNAVVTDRERAPVRLRVSVDGSLLIENTYTPSGIAGDGASIAIERMNLSPGQHRVAVEIEDRKDAAENDPWHHQTTHELTVLPNHRYVLLFDKVNGFTWHVPETNVADPSP